MQANTRPIATALAGWADHGHGSLAQRLAYSLRRLIAAGLLPAGTPLPPERRLAHDLAVSRSTVTAALDVLRSDGLVSSHQGRGTVVAGIGDASSAVPNRMADHLVAGAGGIDLAVGNPADVSHLPAVTVDIGDLLASGAGAGFQPLGLPALRVALAEMHSRTGLHTDAEEVHVTSGAHQAVALAVATVAGRGDAVAVESPGYPGQFDILDGMGARTITVDSDRAGMVPESLERALTGHAIKAVYVQAGPHNPTGVVTPVSRLRALAAVLDAHDVTVVEDATLAELVHDGRPAVDLARLCRRATVISVGSFSKVFWAGLRVGWMRAPIPVIDRSLHRRLALDLGPATPSQLLCLALLPHLDDVAASRRAFLADSTRRAAELLSTEVPEWDVPVPAGGSVLWITTPLADSTPLVHVAHRHGVHVAGGSIAVAGRRPDPHLRVCVDRPWPLVEAGLRRLTTAWRELSRRPGRVAG